jgi:hypothetical protein
VCTIGQKIFHKTFCDVRSGVNIMSKVRYEYLFGNEPLYPTYMQLQMADQSIRFLKGIARDIMVKIQDHYALTDFVILDMDLHKSTFSSQKKRYAIVLIVILLMSS